MVAIVMSEQMAHILLVEDEMAHAELVRRAFEAQREQFHLSITGSLAEARACLSEGPPNLIIADLHLPDGLGTGLLPAEGEERTVPLVVMTAQGDEASAVEAMKAGALDYLVKSEEVLADMPRIAERALREWRHITERQVAEQALRRFSQENAVMAEIGRIVNSSLDIEEVYQRIGNEVGKLINFDRLSIAVIDRENQISVNTYITGIDIPALPLGRTIPLPESSSGRAVSAKATQLILPQHEQELAELFPGMVAAYEAGLKSFMLVPLISQGEVVAVMRLQSIEANAYSEDDVRVAELVGAQIAGAIANAQLYGERVEAEEAVRQSEERYRDLYEHTRVMMHSIDREGNLLSVNDYWLEALGYERSEVIGRQSTEFLTEASRRYAVEVALLEFWKTGVASEVEYQMVKKNGEVMDLLLSGVSEMDKSGDIEYTRCFIVDITERKRAEDKVKASLQEKEVLLKEINHRVKNNLQIISSLLNLQSRDIQDEQTLRSFQVSQDRIKAMALVHEKLYQSEDLSRIDFGEYIQSLADDLRSSYGLRSQNVKLNIDVGDILLGVDTAIPCGVIVNELVSNSLKHAFPGDRPGEIGISFREVDGRYTMVFKDDGVGIPEDLDISQPSSLGLTIVNALVGQLGGAIEIGRNGGSEIRITFPAKQTKGD